MHITNWPADTARGPCVFHTADCIAYKTFTEKESTAALHARRKYPTSHRRLSVASSTRLQSVVPRATQVALAAAARPSIQKH
jgi:hypothetical protein